MKSGKTFFQRALLLSLLAVAATFIGCSSDRDDAYHNEGVKDVYVASVLCRTPYGESFFYTRGDTTSTWQFSFIEAIEGFEYEEGYEYLLRVRWTIDYQSWPKDAICVVGEAPEYHLLEVLKKVKKDSSGEFFTPEFPEI